MRFRYEYDFLPPGLIPRFIVQSHRNLTEQPTRWYTGVVLKAAGCPILIRADRDKRRIDIAVAGPAGQRRSALQVVLDGLDEVHDRNPEIHPNAKVPLHDRPDIAVGYKHLLNLEAMNGLDHEFLPEGTVRNYTVRELLEGVRRDSYLEREFWRIRGDDDRSRRYFERNAAEILAQHEASSTQQTLGGIASWPTASAYQSC